MIAFDLPDEAATAALAARVAKQAQIGDVIALKGDLGAGKTAFARAFLRGRSDDAALAVPSPTFTLVQVYELPGAPVWHFDFYRLKTADEVWELGIEEAFASGITLIEWPEIAGNLLPAECTLQIGLSPGARLEARRAEIVGGAHWQARLPALDETPG